MEDFKSKINVYCDKDLKCLVWSAEEVKRLRNEFRIVGNLIGAIPQFQQQNIFSSLPLLITKEEVTLLLKKELVNLWDDSSPYFIPTPQEIQNFEDERQKKFRLEAESTEFERQKRSDIFLEKEKKKRKESTKEIEKQKIDNSNDSKKPKHNQGLRFPETITIELTSNHRRTSNLKKFDWKYPFTEIERSRYRIFEDLWSKGNYISSGLKFGGDFLVYQGDPLEYHANYVVIIKSFEQEISPLDLISFGRLAVSVKKSPVLASIQEISPTNYKIHYYTFNWQGVT